MKRAVIVLTSAIVGCSSTTRPPATPHGGEPSAVAPPRGAIVLEHDTVLFHDGDRVPLADVSLGRKLGAQFGFERRELSIPAGWHRVDRRNGSAGKDGEGYEPIPIRKARPSKCNSCSFTGFVVRQCPQAGLKPIIIETTASTSVAMLNRLVDVLRALNGCSFRLALVFGGKPTSFFLSWSNPRVLDGRPLVNLTLEVQPSAFVISAAGGTLEPIVGNPAAHVVQDGLLSTLTEVAESLPGEKTLFLDLERTTLLAGELLGLVARLEPVLGRNTRPAVLFWGKPQDSSIDENSGS